MNYKSNIKFLIIVFSHFWHLSPMHAQPVVLECFDDFPYWHQSGTYNDLLPIISYENNSGETIEHELLIGCGAVAMAQVVNYYRKPHELVRWIPEYYVIYEGSINIYETFSMGPYTYQFEWPNGNLSSNDTKELIYACAISLRTEFGNVELKGGSTSSFTNIHKNLVKYFGYYRNVEYFRSSECEYSEAADGFFNIPHKSYEDLFNKIKFEIDDRRPVLLWGTDQNKDSDHIMLITGYDIAAQKVKVIVGWDKPELNTWYSLNNINPSNFNYSDCILIGTNVVPNDYAYSCPIICANDLISNYNIIRNTNVQPDCPELILPYNGQHGASDQIKLFWENSGDSYGFEISILSEILDSFIVSDFLTYSGSPNFYLDAFLPFNDTITVTINPIDETGNVITCPDQIYYTDTTLCNVKLTVQEVDCLSDSTFSIEVSVEGLINHTYDLWAEDTAGIITSLNSITPGLYVLGPFDANTTVFTIVEDENDPYNCFDSDQTLYPQCIQCGNIELSLNSIFCQNDTLNIEVNLQVDSNVVVDLYTIVPGVNTHNDVQSGDYTFQNLPHGENIVIIAEDTSKPFACYNIIVTDGLVCQENSSTSSISKLEYFIDIDPGYGSGDTFPIPNSHDFMVNRVVALDSISPGVHVFYLRAQNENGTWGFTHRKLFYIKPEIEGQNRILTNLEYFIDTDPEPGSGIPLTLENDTNSIDSYLLPLDSLNPGIHVLYVRGKDNAGNWSFTSRKLFYIRPEGEPSNRLLTSLEYFIDTDPGADMGTPLTLENDTNSIDSYLLPLDTINPGVHVLYVRGKDNGGNWSFTQRKLFYIRPEGDPSNRLLTSLEYFIDTDPGAGMGIPLTLENDTNSIDSYLLPLDTITPGVHVLYIRGKDNAGNWSYTSRKLFYIRPGSESPNRLLTDLEYFIDTDPGFGLGTPLALDNDTNSIALYDIALETFTPGLHHLFVRGKDNQGDWGFTIVKPFTIYVLGPIVYVDWDATGANIGTSWTNAFSRLEPALLLATFYDTIQEIWIAQGVYKPTTTTNRNISFTWADSTKLYGGFIGTETERNQRTPNPALVVLSGDIGISSDSTDNTYHVVVIDSTCQGCYLDRLTIKLGNASGSTNNIDKGAGIYSMGYVEIKDVVVEYSSAASTGAAIYNIGSGADLRMMNCIIRFNNSSSGHDIHNANGSNILIEGNVQIQN